MKIRKKSIERTRKLSKTLSNYLDLYKEKGNFNEFEDNADWTYLRGTVETLARTLTPENADVEIISDEDYFEAGIDEINGWMQLVARACLYLNNEQEIHPLKFEGNWREISGDFLGEIYEQLLAFGMPYEDLESDRLRFCLVDKHWFG